MAFSKARYLAAILAGTVSGADLAGFVKTDTGDTGGGNVFPGVSRPFGVTKLGPDLYTGSDSYSGYQASGNFTGFSMLHESGTGGAPKYGVVSQMPVIGAISNPLEDHNDTRAAADQTELGYYKSSLGSGIKVELGASYKTGLYQYTFPSNGTANNIIVDVSHVLSSYRGQGLEQHYLGGNITVVKTGSGVSYQGSGSYDNGWNRSPQWTVYFCGYFDSAPSSFKTFEGDGNNKGHNLSRYDDSVLSINSTARLGAVFTFSSSSIVSRVGVSFISSVQACESIDREIPAGTSLSALRDETRQAWTDQVLSKVTTTDTDTTNLELLYTSLYFMHLIPTNKTGENPKWQSAEPYYDDIFTLWDLFRCTTSLFHVLQPVAYEEYIRSLIDVWRHDGFMPDARSSFSNGATQGGSNADNVLADAYVKGVRGQVNWEDGFSAMVTDAEVTPPNNKDSRDPTASTKEGRGALPDWLQYGFITPTYGRSASRAIEYAVNDFGLFQVAQGLQKSNQASKYLNRSRFWRNHWNPNSTSLGFSGFVDPRTTSGFLPQNPVDCGGCYWSNYFYEALSWEYSFNAHHDIDTLIALSGGESTFVDRLEMMFVPGKNTGGMGSSTFNYTLFNPGNEPSFTTPFLFNFVGRQDLAVKHSRYVAKTYYHVSPSGLPGNSDAGAMESWLLWVMLGLYPMTGQTTFLIGSPWFSDLTISLSEGKSLHITTDGGSEDAYYVQSLKVNGEQWTKSWVTWDDIFGNGGTLEFELGTEAKLWATGPNPPSPGSEWNRNATIAEILGALPKP
ncbi:glycoside hydrolase family 92 protein [Thozetella sp. PMI_491]|nr:glycoside hydrolase family 92 protein [Thozetella sp. PMI_491]